MNKERKQTIERREIDRLRAENGNLRYRLMDGERIFERGLAIWRREQRELAALKKVLKAIVKKFDAKS